MAFDEQIEELRGSHNCHLRELSIRISVIIKEGKMSKIKGIDDVPIWNKWLLTLPEAAAYTGIGMCKLREMSNEPGCDYIVWVGGKRLFKRLKLEEHLEKAWSV